MNLSFRKGLPSSSGWFGLGLALGISCWSAGAQAQGVDEFGPYGRPQDEKNYESPQHWAAEVRFGPYYPQVDEEFNGSATPLADTLGANHRLMVGIEGDWEALRIPRTLSFGPGFGMGYTVLSRAAQFQDKSLGYADMNTSLKIWVQWVDAVAHIDALNKNFHVPLVFTAKLGMAQALWWAGKGDLKASYQGTVGHGRSWGPHWALGMMFDLNFMQPDRAKHLDAVSDINHMYLFVEWYQMKLGSLSSNQMHVGDSDWVLGYALEF